MPQFGAISIAQLGTCDARLQRIFKMVVQKIDCKVLEGKRTEAQQKLNVANGKSQTLNSKHVYPTDGASLAVDVAPYPIDWKDTKRFYYFAGFVMATANALSVKLRWGGNWKMDNDFNNQQFFDLVHFEIAEP